MVAWTTNDYFRLFDLGRREYRQLGVNRKFENADGILGKIRYCCPNCDGNKLGIIADAFNTGTKLDRLKMEHFLINLDFSSMILKWTIFNFTI